MQFLLANIFKSKTTWLVLLILGALSYHYFKVTGLEHDIIKKDLIISKLNNNLNKAENNTKECTNTNKENEIVLEDYQKDVKTVEKYYIGVIAAKDTVINRLRSDISELDTPIEWPAELFYNECRLKFKTIKDINETNKNYNTYKSLLNIGN